MKLKRQTNLSWTTYKLFNSITCIDATSAVSCIVYTDFRHLAWWIPEAHMQFILNFIYNIV